MFLEALIAELTIDPELTKLFYFIYAMSRQAASWPSPDNNYACSCFFLPDTGWAL